MYFWRNMLAVSDFDATRAVIAGEWVKPLQGNSVE